MAQNRIQVLHVDDEPGFADLAKEFLEREDSRFVIQTVTNAHEALQSLRDDTPDCVVSDYEMPGIDGLEFLAQVRDDYPELPFILFTGKGSEAVASEAVSAGVTDYLQKQGTSEQYELLANRIRNAVFARREAQRANRHEELIRLTELAGDTGGFELNLETGELLLTDGAKRLTGLTDTTSVSVDDALELYPESQWAEIRETFEKAAETGEKTHGRWTLYPDDDEERLVDVTFTPVDHDETDDSATILRGSIHDITERKEHQRKLEQAETLFQASQDSLFLINVAEDFSIERVNAAWETVTGLAAEDVRGQPPTALLGTEQGALIEAYYRDCVARQEPLQYDETIQFNGRQVHCETEIAPVVVDDTVEYIAGSMRDLTEQKQRQQELRRLRQAIDDANVAITLADPSQDNEPLVYVNDAFEEMTGYTVDEVLGRNCRFLQGEATDPEKITALRTAIDEEEPITVEIRNYRKDGTQFWNKLTVTPIYSAAGNLVRYLGTQEDITERKLRQKELEAERRFVQESLDALEDLFYVIDADGTLQRWNQRAVDVTGYTDAELDEMHVSELFPESDQATVAEAIQTTLTSGETTVKAAIRTADDRQIPYEFTAATLTDDTGTPSKVAGIGRDLTERRQREERFRALVEHASDIISVIDPDGEFQYQSPSIESILGYDPADTIGDTAWEYIHPDDRERVIEKFEDWIHAAEKMTQVVEYRAQHADGTWRWMEARGTGEFTAQDMDGYVTYARDVTARKRRREELQELKLQYQSVVENFPDGAVFLFDDDLMYLQAGGNELNSIGITPDEVVGSTPRDLFPASIASDLCQHHHTALAGESSILDQSLNGEQYRIRIAPVRPDEEAVTRGIAVFENITLQAEQRQALERRNERLDEFASIVSHDLRNPLNIAGGYIELAQDTCDAPPLTKAADAIDRSQALVDDLLTIARTGTDLTDVQPVALPDTARQCWDTIDTATDATGTVEITTTARIKADPDRLQQLLENLYRNAVEHGGEGPSIEVGELSDGFYVADNGVGIPQAERDTVFEAGYSTSETGTGFGLRIVKQVADAHGWDIRITDSASGGARFEITSVDFAADSQVFSA